LARLGVDEPFATNLDRHIAPLNLKPGTAIGLVARNRPPHAAAIAAQLAAGRPTCMIYSAQSPDAMAADVAALRLAVVIADVSDWTPALRAAVGETGGLGLAIADTDDAEVVSLTDAASHRGDVRTVPADTAFELLTSGTTGAPKRLPLSWAALDSVVEDARAAYAAPARADGRSTGQLVVHPMGNVAGVNYVAAPLAFGQPIALLEKFDLPAWLEAVGIHEPARSALPPAVIGMILDAGVPPERLASLKVVGTGGAALDPDLQARFEQTYDLAILPAFGATEFGGVIANWTLAMHQAFAVAKRGSAGQARPGVQLRVVNPETLTPLPTGETGLLEAITPRTGAGWVRTNDLASLDADGFLFLHGRADDAINRGGFKVVPAAVAAVLKEHPAVIEAIVLGMPHPRLGAAPVAAVEVRAPLTVEEIEAFARSRLLAYQVPVRFIITDALPRNPSMKPSIPEIRKLFDA
jgi:long-chain acyl-CoA synthetase